MKLLLFDIDGTLLRVTRSGGQIVRSVIETHVGRPITVDGVRFSGRTDLPIIREVLIASGFDPDEAEELLPEVIAAYQEEAMRVLTDGHVNLLPGVRELLNGLARRQDVVLGLLTGNVEPIAWAKLRACGIDEFFLFGAFGSDREDRYELPSIAIERARAATGREFEGKDVVIIGDTEHDILCGRTIGVFSIAVATGHFDRAFLELHEPDLLLDDFTDPKSLVDALFLV